MEDSPRINAAVAVCLYILAWIFDQDILVWISFLLFLRVVYLWLLQWQTDRKLCLFFFELDDFHPHFFL
jgi:hypothetical protein